MRRTLLFGMMAMTIGMAASAALADEAKSAKKGRAPFAHVVIFRMKKDAPNDAVDKALADCQELLAKIPAVHSVRAGRPAEKGTPDVPKMKYDFGLLVLVEDADGLKSYLEHPLHLKFVEKHGPYFDMEKLQVFDFHNQSK
ncbi:MAG: Dabb family protein [Gemmataceae bacterium]